MGSKGYMSYTFYRRFYMFSFFKRKIHYPDLTFHYYNCYLIENFDNTISTTKDMDNFNNTIFAFPLGIHTSLYYNKGKLKGMRIIFGDDWVDFPLDCLQSRSIPTTLSTKEPTFVNGLLFTANAGETRKEDYPELLFTTCCNLPRDIGDVLEFIPLERATKGEYDSIITDDRWFLDDNDFRHLITEDGIRYNDAKNSLFIITTKEKENMESRGYCECIMVNRKDNYKVNVKTDGYYIIDSNRVFLPEEEKEQCRIVKVQVLNQSFITEVDSLEYHVEQSGLIYPEICFNRRELFDQHYASKVRVPFSLAKKHRVHKGDKIMVGFDSTRSLLYSIMSTRKETAFPFPKYCPSCDEKIEVVKDNEGDIFRICTNYNCKEKTLKRLHMSLPVFGFPNSLDILEKLYQCGVYDIADLLGISKGKLMSFLPEEENTKIYERILAARELPMSFFLYNLFTLFSNEEVDMKPTLLLSKRISNFKDISLVEREELEEDGFDNRIVKACFSNGSISFGSTNTLLRKLISLEDDETIRPLYHL